MFSLSDFFGNMYTYSAHNYLDMAKILHALKKGESKKKTLKF